jgi:hypothetical protein
MSTAIPKGFWPPPHHVVRTDIRGVFPETQRFSFQSRSGLAFVPAGG